MALKRNIDPGSKYWGKHRHQLEPRDDIEMSSPREDAGIRRLRLEVWGFLIIKEMIE